MFYHALTGNGGTEDLEPVLLWTNPSPTTEFAAQTVSLDLTDYAGVIIEFHQTDTQSFGTRTYIKKNDTVNGITGAGYVDGSNTNGLARNVTVTDSGVVFGTGNIDCVPNKIYGVKEYVVEPIDNIQDFMTNNLLGIYSNDDTGNADLTINPSECYVCDAGANNVGNSGFKIKKGENFNYSCNYSGNTVNVTGTWSGNRLTVTRSNNFGRTIILFLK